MATTKKTPAKKPAATNAKKDSKAVAAAKKALPRLKAGKTTLAAERDSAGLSSNAPLRKALTDLLGGKKQYQAMMKQNAKVRSEAA